MTSSNTFLTPNARSLLPARSPIMILFFTSTICISCPIAKKPNRKLSKNNNILIQLLLYDCNNYKTFKEKRLGKTIEVNFTDDLVTFTGEIVYSYKYIN